MAQEPAPGSGRDEDRCRAAFRKVVTDAFVPGLMAPARPFRPGLRVRGVQARPNVFEKGDPAV